MNACQGLALALILGLGQAGESPLPDPLMRGAGCRTHSTGGKTTLLTWGLEMLWRPPALGFLGALETTELA